MTISPSHTQGTRRTPSGPVVFRATGFQAIVFRTTALRAHGLATGNPCCCCGVSCMQRV